MQATPVGLKLAGMYMVSKTIMFNVMVELNPIKWYHFSILYLATAGNLPVSPWDFIASKAFAVFFCYFVAVFHCCVHES
jgi:hypothetical protein